MTYNEIHSFKSEKEVKKHLGEYYTPQFLAKMIAKEVCGVLSSEDWLEKEVRIVDPFCGDGQLILALLEEIESVELNSKIKRISIWLWDIKPDTVKNAKLNLAGFNSKSIEPIIDLHFESRDSFLYSLNEYRKFNFVITNPPWETIKPSKKDLESYSDDEIANYKISLKSYDNRLAHHLPESQPTKKFAGWGTNLSRCGLELSIRLLTENGTCIILLPQSILMDSLSGKLRKWVICNAELKSVSLFPANLKLFKGVDQDTVMLFLSKQPTTTSIRYDLNIYKKDFNKEHIIVSKRIEAFYKSNYVINCNSTVRFEHELRGYDDMNTLLDFEKKGVLWLGRELDETRIARFFTEKNHSPKFIKGKNIQRFFASIEDLPRIETNSLNLPKSVGYRRLVWRDVARKTLQRRVFATLIDNNIVAGNSLHVLHTYNNEDLLKALLVLFNSLVFELQVRILGSTGHISLNVIRQVKIPDVLNPKTASDLASIADLVVNGKISEEEFEVLIAKYYKVSREEMEVILKFFDKIPHSTAERILTSAAWL